MLTSQWGYYHSGLVGIQELKFGEMFLIKFSLPPLQCALFFMQWHNANVSHGDFYIHSHENILKPDGIYYEH